MLGVVRGCLWLLYNWNENGLSLCWIAIKMCGVVRCCLWLLCNWKWLQFWAPQAWKGYEGLSLFPLQLKVRAFWVMKRFKLFSIFSFLVDALQAGEGQLEILVNNGTIPNTVQMRSRGIFGMSFVPRDASVHNIDVRFNGVNIPGKLGVRNPECWEAWGLEFNPIPGRVGVQFLYRLGQSPKTFISCSLLSIHQL